MAQTRSDLAECAQLTQVVSERLEAEPLSAIFSSSLSCLYRHSQRPSETRIS